MEIALRNKKHEIIDFAYVDKEDFINVNKYKWHIKPYNGINSVIKYVFTQINKVETSLHKFIMGKPEKGNVIDHLNGNGLNNTRKNLRIVSYSHNSQNKTKAKNASSIYRGVSICNKSKRWVATYSSKYIGKYDEEEIAAQEYDKYTYHILGKDAISNILTYQEYKQMNISDEYFVKTKTKTLPTNIFQKYNKFYVIKKHKNTIYKSICVTLDEALIELENIKKQILQLIKDEELLLKNKEIIRNKDGIAIIPIFNNKKEKVLDVLLDDDKWHDMCHYKWSLNSASNYIKTIKNRKNYSMHELILPNTDKDNLVIDHINHIRHDNRRSNLRLNTFSGNSHNKRKNSNTSSKYYGVSFNNKEKKWAVAIKNNNVIHNLGQYDNEHQAAETYNFKAKELYGDFANLNVVPNKYEVKPKKKTRNYKNKYIGVSFNISKKIYQVTLIKDNVRYYIGSFKNEIDGAIAYNNKAIELFGDSAQLNEIPSSFKSTMPEKKKYRGVSYCKNNKKYRSVIAKDKKTYRLGHWSTEHEAAYAYNLKAIELYGNDYKFLNKIEVEVTLPDKYRGLTKKDNKYYVFVHADQKKHYVGSFYDKKEAMIAYNKRAIELLGDKAKLNKIV